MLPPAPSSPSRTPMTSPRPTATPIRGQPSWGCSSGHGAGLCLEPGLGGCGVVLVDVHDHPVVRVEQGAGDGGAVARPAVDPDLPGRHLVLPVEQLVDGDVLGAGDVSLAPLVVAARVEDVHGLARGGGLVETAGESG